MPPPETCNVQLATQSLVTKTRHCYATAYVRDVLNCYTATLADFFASGLQSHSFDLAQDQAMKRYAYGLVLALLFTSLTAYGQTMYSASGSQGLGFGGAIAISDQQILVGSSPIGWPRGEEPAGAVYLFERMDEGTWAEAGRLTSSDGRLGDNFGRAVMVQGAMAVVSAPGSSAAYVFEKDASGDWQETGKLMPSEMGDGAEFGGAYMRGGNRTGTLAQAGERLVVTSYNRETDHGAVHVFVKEGNQWQEEAMLTHAELEAGEGFGWAVVADGDHIFVSAHQADTNKGVVIPYTRTAAGLWKEGHGLTSEDLEGRSRFGQTIAFHDGRLFVGAPSQGMGGAVFVFEPTDEGQWAQVHRVDAPAPTGDVRRVSGFGSALALSGETLLVSARGQAVYAYALSGGMAEASGMLMPDYDNQSAFGMGLAVEDHVAAVGTPGADYEEGIATVYERNPDTNEWTPVSMLVDDPSFLTSINGNQVDCEEGKADVFDCDGVDLISFMSIPDLASERGVKMTDIWGWEDPETGHEWVLQARTEGVSFVNISDPYNPVYVGQLLKTESSPGSAWRDVKVYKDHAFVVADGAAEHGIQIFDLTQLRDVKPEDMPVTFDMTAHYTGVHSTHNIVINEETGFAYAVGNRAGGETCAGQLHMVNIQDPQNPEFVGCFSHPNAGGTHDSQCVIYEGNDSNYQGREICFNSNSSSFIIADVTDKENPVTVAHTDYPNLAYTHQGWLTEDHRYFYMNDELDELNGNVEGTRTLIWDVEDLEDPILVQEFMLNNKASDHNLYIRGNLMYQSNYQSGLRIIDISEPLNPKEVAHFDTVPFGEDAPGFGGSWSNYPYFKSGVIAVSSRGEGLFLVKKQQVDL